MLSQFTSIFEILTAFNFAYAVTDTFTETLHSKVLSAFKNLRRYIETVKGKVVLSKETIQSLPEQNINGKTNKKHIEKCTTEVNDQDSMFDRLERSIDIRIKRAGLNFSFQYLCFYNALFCLLILVPIGFIAEDELKSYSINDCSIKCALFCAASGSIIFQIACIWWDRLNMLKNPDLARPIGYKRTFLIFATVGVIAFSMYVTNFFKLHIEWDTRVTDTILVSTCLLAGSLHFVYYFYRAWKNANIKAAAFRSEVQRFEKEFDNWHNENVISMRDLDDKIDRFYED